MPKHCTWDAKAFAWRQRKRAVPVIGRIHNAHPQQQERFYLRMLLHHPNCLGAISFTSLRTVHGHTYATFREA